MKGEGIKENTKSNLFGYTRISSRSQENNVSLTGQKKFLLSKGITEENIFSEISLIPDSILTENAREKMPIFHRLIEKTLKDGDVLHITKMDRCFRNTLSYLKLQENFKESGITLVVFNLPYSDNFNVQKMLSSIMASLAQFEREQRRARQRVGIQQARKQGNYKGRQTVIDETLIRQVKTSREEGLTVRPIATLTHKSPTTIYKVLKKHLDY